MQARTSTSVYSTRQHIRTAYIARQRSHLTPRHVNVRYFPAGYVTSGLGPDGRASFAGSRIVEPDAEFKTTGGLGHVGFTYSQKVPLDHLEFWDLAYGSDSALSRQGSVDDRQVIHVAKWR